MKNTIITALVIIFLFQACTTSRQMNATYEGAMLGGIFGSCIGEISGGHRGYHAGQLLGMTIGGVIGAASTAQSRKITPYDSYKKGKDFDVDQYNRRSSSNPQSSYSSSENYDLMSEYQALEIENLRFIDRNNNHAIDADEHCKLVFEVRNTGKFTVNKIAPLISCSDKKHVIISPTAIIGSIEPGKAMQYTAEIYGKPNIKNGEVDFSIGFIKRDLVYSMEQFQLKTIAR